LALPAGAALVATRPPDALEALLEWRASTVPATIKKIVANKSGKDRFMPSLTYDAISLKVVVVPDAASITRRILGGVNEASVPTGIVRRSHCLCDRRIPRSGKTGRGTAVR
jgi:hypothetical protein